MLLSLALGSVIDMVYHIITPDGGTIFIWAVHEAVHIYNIYITYIYVLCYIDIYEYIYIYIYIFICYIYIYAILIYIFICYIHMLYSYIYEHSQIL